MKQTKPEISPQITFGEIHRKLIKYAPEALRKTYYTLTVPLEVPAKFRQAMDKLTKLEYEVGGYIDFNLDGLAERYILIMGEEGSTPVRTFDFDMIYHTHPLRNYKNFLSSKDFMDMKLNIGLANLRDNEMIDELVEFINKQSDVELSNREINMILESADEIKEAIMYFDPPSSADLLINQRENIHLFEKQDEIVTKIDLVFTPYGTFAYSYNPLTDENVDMSLQEYIGNIKLIVSKAFATSIKAVWLKKELRRKKGLSDISLYMKTDDKGNIQRKVDVLSEIDRQVKLGPLKDLKNYGFNIQFFPYNMKSFTINGTAIEER